MGSYLPNIHPYPVSTIAGHSYIKLHLTYDGQGEYCGLSTASEVFLVFKTQLYQYFSVFELTK